ncbi:OB-fold domain-containing protein [Saccharopolyspora indica]|uniref:Zn-ribbon domain-containing OB-fold protein n=1 Tax=Saccharopolyspora indica TaxID=1229659 RepID=UPI0022EAE6D1|nr:OB-fold domain-containing protein [Saccharopolyspora indica]MDA3642964.1 OB-fold domain-containing protein [Saccharopolyspora indica]
MPIVPVARDTASAPFYDGTAREELLLRRCDACSSISAPNVESCSACGGTALSWTPASGIAQLVTWTVVHGRSPVDGEHLRIVAGLVELAEGPWLYARIVDIAPEDVTTGLALAVGFDHAEGSETVPVFRPA